MHQRSWFPVTFSSFFPSWVTSLFLPHQLSQDRENHPVFIIHGHDGLTKEQVARFVERLGIETIIPTKKSIRG